MSDTPETSTDADVEKKDDDAVKPASSTVAAASEPAAAPAPASAPAAPRASRRPSPTGQAVGGVDTDEVHLCKCIVKNVYSKKSLSVHHVQRRLVELGFNDALGDKDGWYGDDTVAAVAAYQKANGLDGDGVVDAATLEHLFADDPNVTVAC